MVVRHIYIVAIVLNVVACTGYSIDSENTAGSMWSGDIEEISLEMVADGARLGRETTIVLLGSGVGTYEVTELSGGNHGRSGRSVVVQEEFEVQPADLLQLINELFKYKLFSGHEDLTASYALRARDGGRVQMVRVGTIDSGMIRIALVMGDESYEVRFSSAPISAPPYLNYIEQRIRIFADRRRALE